MKVQIIFTAANDNNDIKAAPAKHLMAIYEGGDDTLTQQALDDWYKAEKKDYEVFKAKYSLGNEPNKLGEKLAAMKVWCDETKINFTPTVFIDGYRLPEIYRIDDVKHFL